LELFGGLYPAEPGTRLVYKTEKCPALGQPGKIAVTVVVGTLQPSGAVPAVILKGSSGPFEILWPVVL